MSFTILLVYCVMPLTLCTAAGLAVARARGLAQLRYCLRTVREYEFAPVDASQLAEPIRRMFDQHTPALVQLGFQPIGDFRMKSKPVEVHDRLFLSRDGNTLTAICAVLKGGGVAFMSVLSDGTAVHTSSSKNPRPQRTLEPDDQLCMTYLPEIPLADVYAGHVQALASEGAARGATPLAQTAETFREVLVYDQRIFQRWRYCYGDLPAEPAAPDFDGLVAALSAAQVTKS